MDGHPRLARYADIILAT